VPPTDAELVGKTRDGDWSAFSQLVDRYRDAVCGLAYHHLRDFDRVQDAAQETFVRAWQYLSQLRRPDRFAPWLRRIAATVSIEFLRRRARQAISLDTDQTHTTSARQQSPDEDVERLAARMVVQDALARLPDPSRLTVTLYYINGYSHGEIAHFLGLPINTVRTRLRRAKHKLREEMIAMVTDVLQSGRPDPAFTRQVVEEAMRQGDDAHKAHATADALRHYDEALIAADKLPAGPDRQRLEMDLLWKKGGASEFSPGWSEAVKLYEQALALARELGDEALQARMLAHIGVTRSNMGERDAARDAYAAALDLYRSLGDKSGQGMTSFWIASLHLFDKQPAPARPHLKRALALLEAAGSHEWVAVCRAALDLIRAVPANRFPSLVEYSATCVGIRKEGRVVSFHSEPGVGFSELADAPAIFSISDVFHQIGQLHTFLDPAVPVRKGWSGDAFSYSYRPLKAAVTVKSDSESVTVPAGSFDNCLLTEQVTTASDLPDDADGKKKDLNRRHRCGTRRAWFARGVGLVQLHVERGDGVTAVIQLQDFTVAGRPRTHLPLALGNSWSYGWADAPADFIAKDIYRVDARKGPLWYLAHHSYIYPSPGPRRR
jgi:RNA polymerase sigma-70 factor (ECF subfamily)